MPTEILSRAIKLILLLLLPVALYAIPEESIFGGGSICLFTNIFGIECWGCGITRAIFSALYLRFADAWEYNKLVVLVLPLLAFLWLRGVVLLVIWLKNAVDKNCQPRQ